MIFANNLNVGAHEHLEARAEAVPRVILRCRRAVHEVRMRIHGVVMEGSDQPWIEPVVGPGESAGKFDCGSHRDGRRRSWSDDVVVVMPEHSESVHLQLAVFETQITPDAIEGLFNCGQSRKEQAVLILLILAVVIQESNPDGSVIPRTGWTSCLNGIAAFRVAFQVEFL